MDRIDMTLDDIIKGNKKKSKQTTRTTSTGNNNTTNNPGNNNNNNNNSNNNNINRNNKTTGPIRTRSTGKKLTRQKTNPYPKPRISKSNNSNGVWRHDLFQTLNSGAQNKNAKTKNNDNLGLSIRRRLGTGNNNGSGGSGVVNRLSIKGAAGNQQARYSIKGEGGPATIIINNLAPGTSANDIKTAFMEFGEISTMNVDERLPINPVKAELTFESKASALAAIKKYNTALVDGYVLKVQLKQPSGNLNTGVATYRMSGKYNKPSVRTNGKLYSDQLLSGQRNRRVAGGNKGKQSSFGVSY